MNNLPPSISVAIITKDRKKELRRCLLSLKRQKYRSFMIIVIDNDENQSAQAIVNNRLFNKLNIKYHHLAHSSVPACRNSALKLVKTPYLAFIDDDCIANENWLTEGLRTIKKEKAHFVLGKTELYNPQNLFALAQHARDSYWNDYNNQLFDTKNVIVNAKYFKKNNLSFDEKCQSDHYDSADFDFDFLAKKKKLKKIYCPQMIIFHKETDKFSRFTKRAYHRGKLAKYLNNKWQLNHQLVDLRNRHLVLFILRAFKNFSSDYNKYKNYMYSQTTFKKLFATWLIKIFEGYYLRGYLEKN